MGSEYEMESEGHVWTNVLAGATIGFVVGASLALLFAPKSGVDLRSDIGGAVDGLKDKAEQMLDELQGSAAELVNKSKDALEHTRENIVRSVEAGKEAYAQKKDELTAQLER
jgi:gas vesicle protein